MKAAGRSEGKMDGSAQKMALNNMRLAYFAAERFRSSGLDMEELQASAFLGLVKAAASYDESKGTKFTTYAMTVMNNELRMMLRRERRHPQCLSLDKEMLLSGEDRSYALRDVIPSKETGYAEVEHSDLCDSLLALPRLKDGERQAIRLVVLQGMSQKAAGRLLGVSQESVSRRIKRGIDKIRAEF